MDMNTITFSRQGLASILSSLSMEDKAWAIKYLADNLLMGNEPAREGSTQEDRPYWWNRPISAEVMGMTLRQRKELPEDYKQTLQGMLEEEYL